MFSCQWPCSDQVENVSLDYVLFFDDILIYEVRTKLACVCLKPHVKTPSIVRDALTVGGLAKNMLNEKKVWGLANFGSNQQYIMLGWDEKYVGTLKKFKPDTFLCQVFANFVKWIKSISLKLKA
jgi:hypothetical protein